MIIMIISITLSEPCQRAEKSMETESDSNTNGSWNPWNSPRHPGKEN